MTESLDRLRPGLLLVLRARVQPASLAEDLCNEALRIVIERLEREPLTDPDRLAAFLAQTARNLVIAEKRRDARRQTMTGADRLAEQQVDEGADLLNAAQRRSREAAVHRMLTELRNPRYRQLLVRYYLEDEDSESICRDLGLRPAQFNRVIFRARERLRELLERRYRASDLLGIVLL